MIRAIGLVVLGIHCFFSSNAVACSCLPCYPRTEKECVLEARRTSTVVFSGEVVAVEPQDTLGRSVAVSFKVDRVWKGPRAGKIVVFANVFDGANCGFVVAVGQTWLIYASSSKLKELWTDSCTRTRALADAREDLKALGKGREPQS